MESIALKLLLLCKICLTCDNHFVGFGVHLGSNRHLDEIDETGVHSVITNVYHNLKIRHFRISLEPYFSLIPNVYTLDCNSSTTGCTRSWNTGLKFLSNQKEFPGVKIIASVWSPPHHLMDRILLRLLPNKEIDYYYYLTNVTKLIHEKYGITIEKISPVNEPENIWATWDHCNMDPSQLCRMVNLFNDSRMNLCPENSYFWMSELYLSYKNSITGVSCLKSCKIMATHGYWLNFDPRSPNYKLAYYDLTPYESHFHGIPIWLTEVSSTYYAPEKNEMDEALDLATNVIHFLSVTCVERYYFWAAFTFGPSGESLIWGIESKSSHNETNSSYSFHFPKKYFVFNQFTNASERIGPKAIIQSCKETHFLSGPGKCVTFFSKQDNVTIFLNKETREIWLDSKAQCPCGICCTTNDQDLICTNSTMSTSLTEGIHIPPRSVCTCVGSCH